MNLLFYLGQDDRHSDGSNGKERKGDLGSLQNKRDGKWCRRWLLCAVCRCDSIPEVAMCIVAVIG